MAIPVKAGEMTSAKSASPPPPPPPPPRRSWSSSSSVTRREIEKFWRKKRLVEEEHLLAAIKAAARLRAARLSEEDYQLFLEDIQEEVVIINKGSAGNTNHQEVRVGIKDWWTKSKYAYLNQPAVGSSGRSSGKANRRSNYVPNKCYFCNYKYSPATATPPTVSAQARAQALPPYLGVF
uniref:Uncharacterized protein n=1 Tax=Opuntia streptacantha TaxID=393608 RepID=A0A7C9D0P6_OPUST